MTKMVFPMFRFGPGTSPVLSHGKDVLGGKGYGLALMTEMDIPVPPGFTIATSVCHAVRKGDGFDAKMIDDLMEQVEKQMTWLRSQFGFMPLVSVRSGAPLSMPGMMDTILNVGLSNKNLTAWKERIGERAALDSYRRLIQMLGTTAFGIDAKVFDQIVDDFKAADEALLDSDLSVNALEGLVARLKLAFKEVTGDSFPDDPWEQLRSAMLAVFESWNNDRAKHYRQMNGIDEAMGTAVNVQAMVFGNMNDDSGSGVMFTRNPSTGDNEILGEFLPNAQGEDVVAGTRTPYSIVEMMDLWPQQTEQLYGIARKLEEYHRDMMDLEFTVQDGVLYLLQCRVGKRSALAAFRIAVDLVEEELIDRDEALKRIKPSQLALATRPMVDPAFNTPPLYEGLPASPGVVTGIACLSADEAVKMGKTAILVAEETTPDDIAGMEAAAGILTSRGGATSHAAVVARSMDQPCVVGCTGAAYIVAGKKVTIDGGTGHVWLDIDVPVIDGSQHDAVQTVLAWAMDKAGTLAASDTPAAGKLYRLQQHMPNQGTSQWLSGLEDQLAAVDGTVYLDIRRPQPPSPETDPIVSLFPPTETKAGISDKAIIGWLQSLGIKDKVVLITDHQATAEAAGLTVLPIVDSLNDLLSAEGLVVVSQAIKDDPVVGPDSVRQIIALMNQSGKDVREFAGALPAEYVAYGVLGQG